jgi:hypothetical protein
MSHWYKIVNGVPQRYEQLKKDGTPSKVIKREKAIADGAVESTNTILDRCSEIGGLLYWGAKIAATAGVEVALADPTAGQEAALKAAMELYNERKEEAANKGSEIHSAIDTFLRNGILPEEGPKRVACLTAKRVLDEHGAVGGNAEVCFVYHGNVNGRKYAFGGTPDWAGKAFLFDWKTKAGKADPKARECAQLASYRIGTGNVNARCVNVYIDRDSGELIKLREWTEQELALGWELFECAYRVSELNELLG